MSSPYKISKLEYKITESIKGKCPHCNKDIDISNTQELSDDWPSISYFDMSHSLFQKNVDDYIKFVSENKTFVNHKQIVDTWRERIEKLQVKSIIESKTICVLSGNCPYCNNHIDIRIPYTISYQAPPSIIQLLDNKITPYIEDCPICGRRIHISDKRLLQGDEYYYEESPAKKIGRPQKSLVCESEKYTTHTELLKNTCKECGTVYIDLSKGCPVCELKNKLLKNI